MKNLNKLAERKKVQDVLFKIYNNTFSSLDIDFLLIKLREHSKYGSIFQEIAHFAAHNEYRDKGQTFFHMNGFFSSIIFLIKHCLDQKDPLDFNKPIPAYVINKIKFNATLEKDHFNNKFKCSYTQFESKFNNAFQKIKGTDTYKLKGTLKGTLKAIVDHMLLMLMVEPAFTGDQIINEMMSTLRENKFEVDDALFMERSSKIILCVLLLMNGTEYRIDENFNSFSFIKILKENDQDYIQLASHITYLYNNKDMTFIFPLISTTIKPSEYLSNHLLLTDLNTLNPHNLFINNDGKLDLIGR